ncbi:DUF3261 domain-containing protein [Vibrio aquaticus]|uniref:DUF3261 domain-containing protein n=1 Tax=Vibrio aquaticus TaxID=2496559 RepID=A0A432D1D6_9VIBR|nr:DUF3261 domain-containing protein [Vibrio aquaticus]RTZ17716.1 DUF3261 domain-containing protein [Vibrio aquaticus]
MTFAHWAKIGLVIGLSGALLACAAKPQVVTPQVEIAKGELVNLPTPRSLGYGLTASQLISASWSVDRASRSEQLPVQLQVSSEKVVLAGFSSWGTRILSLTYQGQEVTTEVLPGLGNVLPPPEQVLFNLMITLWPRSAWDDSLNKVRWQVIDTADSRAIFDAEGQQVIDIKYGNNERLNSEIVFHHLVDDYTITINTLQFQKEPTTAQ